MEVKYPLVLPSSLRVIEALVRFIHRRSSHFGRNFLLSAVYETFWIIGLGSLVKRVFGGCVQSRKQHGVPFSSVGINYFGPFLVVQGKDEVGL